MTAGPVRYHLGAFPPKALDWPQLIPLLGPANAGFFMNLTPFFAALLSAAFLGEAPQAFHAAAFVLIVAGIVLSSRR